MAANRRRQARFDQRNVSQESGLGMPGNRTMVTIPGGGVVYVPAAMTADPGFKGVVERGGEGFERMRVRYDFPYWCIKCCHIRSKSTGEYIPLRLNRPQLRVVSILEEDREAGRPLRLIMLKARQWGGSTLVQMYMAWIQCTQRQNWNSLICAHVKDTAATIRGMYTEMLARYPEAMWHGEEGSCPEFKAFERTGNVRVINGRGCRVTLGSSENQEAVRGADYAMAHLSEVAFWADSRLKSPEQFVRAVCGSINLAPLTLIAMESTANGVGNFFHTEWKRAEAGKSDKRPVFVPWHEIDIYRAPVDDPRELWESLDDYERELWDLHGCSLEQIQWYKLKRREYSDHAAMQAEYPTTPDEAFSNTGTAVFNPLHVEAMRPGCCDPVERGDMVGPVMTGPESRSMTFTPGHPSTLSVWHHPEVSTTQSDESRYIVTVDIGGRSRGSDWSVIAVFDRQSMPGKLEVVAQWRGHCDHDILAWKAVAIARRWDNALLVFESNTLETDNTDGDPAMFILNRVADAYLNLYRRPPSETAGGGGQWRVGFHTNRATKTAAINRLIAALRDGELVERDHEALNEMLTFQYFPGGSTGAKVGSHDDLVITRAMAFVAADTHVETPDERDTAQYFRS